MRLRTVEGRTGEHNGAISVRSICNPQKTIFANNHLFSGRNPQAATSSHDGAYCWRAFSDGSFTNKVGICHCSAATKLHIHLCPDRLH